MDIRPLSSDAERDACARIMFESDPWRTLGYPYEDLAAALAPVEREIYVVKDGGAVAGFVVISMRGILAGYVQSIAIAAPHRGRGLGTELMRFVEQRVFRERPNVFLFVSSFNHGARRLYESLGYERVGTVKDFLVAGYDEHLMRKTIGPLRPRRGA